MPFEGRYGVCACVWGWGGVINAPHTPLATLRKFPLMKSKDILLSLVNVS